MATADRGTVGLVEVTRRDVSRVAGGGSGVAPGAGRGSGPDVVESVHAGDLVVVDADGTSLAALGTADREVFVRSAAKPVQAIACLELLGQAGRAGPTSDELAVAWASHRAEARHLEVVTRLLARSGRTPEELTCTPGVGDADPGATPTALRGDCSGKHALFALAGDALGISGPALLEIDGPLQRHVLAVLERELGDGRAVGVDGCGAPAVTAPLHGLATCFARLAVAEADTPAGAVRDAGLAHPGLVGGQRRLETALLAAGVVAKPGAEGVFAAGWRGPDGAGRGVAVKAADGAGRGAGPAVAALLTAAGVVPEGTWVHPPPLGGSRPAGEVRASSAVVDLAATLSS